MFRILDIYFFCVLLVISFVALGNCTLCFKSAFMLLRKGERMLFVIDFLPFLSCFDFSLAIKVLSDVPKSSH